MRPAKKVLYKIGTIPTPRELTFSAERIEIPINMQGDTIPCWRCGYFTELGYCAYRGTSLNSPGEAELCLLALLPPDFFNSIIEL